VIKKKSTKENMTYHRQDEEKENKSIKSQQATA
jgi:hypothetical protein